jgi:signal transduction histidine kinase
VTQEPFLYRDAQGRDHVILVSTSPLRVEGRVEGVVVIWHDVTERENLLRDARQANRQLEEARRDAERAAAGLTATINSMASGVVIYDSSGSITHMNSAAARALNYSPSERGLPWERRLQLIRVETPEGQPFRAGELPAQRALRGETVEGVTMIVHQRGGPPLVVSASAAPIRTPEGENLGVVATFADVSAVHELQQQRDDLVRALSHDLRSPLTAILGHAQMLHQAAQAAGVDVRLQRHSAAIVTGAKRMEDMISQLVEMNRLESGQLPLRRETVDLGAFLADLLERASQAMESSRLRVEVARDLPPVSADPSQLERIFTNLLTNSLKYSRPGTPVTLSAEGSERWVTISVADQGEGIPEAERQHVFHRFWRGRGAARAEGTGLGLYITRLLVEAHGGCITVESRPGQGSTFEVVLPVAKES